MDQVERRITEKGYCLPAVNTGRRGIFVPTKRVGDMVYVSGHGPQSPDGKSMVYKGKLGSSLTSEEGREAAKLCVLSCLSSLKREVGSLDSIEMVTMRGFVSSTPDFTEQPEVMNGASELLLDILGERGTHARTAIATPVLPGDIAVEIQMVVRVVEA